MKRAISLLLLPCLWFLCLPLAAAAEAPAVSAKSMIVIHADSGRTLYEKNADERMLIASTTKIMTALVALENCDPLEEVLIKPEYTGVEGSSIYLTAGDTYTLEELLYGLILSSGNDAAVAIACHVAGSVEQFAQLMNEKAAALGLQNTSFQNPHGLDAAEHYGSARDLAVIMAAAMRLETFAAITAAKSFSAHGLTFVNHNKLLWNYDGCLGGKTGYTQAAGRSLVSCAERDGLRLICVTLADPDDWRDHTNLFNAAFAHYRAERYPAGARLAQLPVISGASESVPIVLAAELCAAVPTDATPTLRLRLPRFVFAEVGFGARAGTAAICLDGVPLAEVTLIYGSGVRFSEAARLRAWDRLQRMISLADRYTPYTYYRSM